MAKILLFFYETVFFLGSQKISLFFIYIGLKLPFYQKIPYARGQLLLEIVQKTLRLGIFLISHLSFYFFRIHTVASQSMSPYLEKGDIVFVECFTMGVPLPLSNFTQGEIYRLFSFRKLKEKDVVLFRLKSSKNLMVKRISQILPNGEISLRGDNVRDSYDSRHFGNIKKTAIIGRVFYIARKQN